MSNTEPRLLYLTAPSTEVAQRIAEAVVGERLAACANLLAPMTSVYRWEGAVERGEEIPVLLKTTIGGVERLVERVVALHPYACPCVLVLPVAGGNPPFLQWIADQVDAAEPSRTED